MATTIPIKVTWESIIQVLIYALKYGEPEGQKAAEEEIKRMAKIADLYAESVGAYDGKS